MKFSTLISASLALKTISTAARHLEMVCEPKKLQRLLIHFLLIQGGLSSPLLELHLSICPMELDKSV